VRKGSNVNVQFLLRALSTVCVVPLLMAGCGESAQERHSREMAARRQADYEREQRVKAEREKGVDTLFTRSQESMQQDKVWDKESK
jgi:hypothetical protein